MQPILRGTTDGIFSLRELVEKRLERQGHMALAFVDLEKAFDTVPRKMAVATLGWMGAPESEVRMVEAMYENTKGRVVVGSGMSNEFQVTIGLRQGSALSRLLFILVMELISRKISTTDAPRKIMYADDLVIVSEFLRHMAQSMMPGCLPVGTCSSCGIQIKSSRC